MGHAGTRTVGRGLVDNIASLYGDSRRWKATSPLGKGAGEGWSWLVVLRECWAHIFALGACDRSTGGLVALGKRCVTGI